MKIDVTTVLNDLADNPLPRVEPIDEFDPSKGVRRAGDLTLRDAVVLALTTPTRGDETLAGTKKLEMARLAHRFMDGDEITLSIDEAGIVKARAGMVLTPVALMRLDDCFEAAADA